MKTKLFSFSMMALCAMTMNVWAQPIVSAPTPPEYATNKVIALYTDAAYENKVGWNFGDWGSGTVYSEVTIGTTTDKAAKFTTTDLGYFGWEFHSPVNAVPMTHLHLDVWSDEAFQFGLVPIYSGQAADVRQTISIKAGEWTTIDLTVQSYIDLGLDASKLIQFKFDNIGARTFYVDNVYFYNSSTDVDTEKPSNPTASLVSTSYFSVTIACVGTDNSGSVSYTVSTDEGAISAEGGAASGETANITITGLQPGTEYTFTVTASDLDGNTSDIPATVTATTVSAPEAAPAPDKAAKDVISIYSDAYEPATWFGIGGWGQSTMATECELAAGEKAYLLDKFNYLGLELNNNAAAFDASAMEYLHIDVWTKKDAQLSITPIWGAEALYECKPIEKEQWNAFDIPLSVFTGIKLDNIYQLKLAGGDGAMTLFIDNIYFWKEASTTLFPMPEANIHHLAAVDGTLTVEADRIAEIQVYDLRGICLASQTTQNLSISLPEGIYIVSIDGQTAKIAMK